MNKVEISLQEALDQHTANRVPGHLMASASLIPDSDSPSVRVNVTKHSQPKVPVAHVECLELDEPTSERGDAQESRTVNRSQECCGEAIRFFWAEDGRYMGFCRVCGNKVVDSTQLKDSHSPWIGVDLDGTLATDTESKGGDEIGAPIEPMVQRVKAWVSQGMTVKIFTARAANPRQVVKIQEWLKRFGLPDLEITNVKDFRMIQLWDDRCVRVVTNQGLPAVSDVPESVKDSPGRLGETRGRVTRKKPGSNIFSTLRYLFTL